MGRNTQRYQEKTSMEYDSMMEWGTEMISMAQLNGQQQFMCPKKWVNQHVGALIILKQVSPLPVCICWKMDPEKPCKPPNMF